MIPISKIECSYSWKYRSCPSISLKIGIYFGYRACVWYYIQLGRPVFYILTPVLSNVQINLYNVIFEHLLLSKNIFFLIRPTGTLKLIKHMIRYLFKNILLIFSNTCTWVFFPWQIYIHILNNKKWKEIYQVHERNTQSNIQHSFICFIKTYFSIFWSRDSQVNFSIYF